MLAFVSSMPHPAGCASYRRRSRLLVETLHSILRQREREIAVVVVVNEVPQCTLPDDPRLELVQVDFPPASDLRRPSLVGIMNDKGAKLAVGTAAALRQQPRYVMYVDSDDYVHRDLAGFVAAQGGGPGWYSGAGYFHVRGTRTVRAIDREFHRRNGSTHILAADVPRVPEDVSPAMSRREVLDRVGREHCHALMGTHRTIVDYLAQMGTPLAPLPFPAAIWQIGTGENCTGALAAAGRREPVAGRIADEFGLPVPGVPAAAVSAARSLAARVAQRLRRGRSE